MDKVTHKRALAGEFVHVPVVAKVSIERIADTLCCALEGGSVYWCDSFEPARYPEGVEWGHEAAALCVPFTIEYDGECLAVANSKEHMMDTLALMARRYPNDFDDLVGGTEDANTGDILFQLLCFGEVVYG